MEGFDVSFDIFLGIIAPLIISALKQKSWSDSTKIALTFGVCIILSVFSMFITSPEWDWYNATQTVGTIFTAAVLMYKGRFETTKLNKELEQLGATESGA